jgi:hypothetical protein
VAALRDAAEGEDRSRAAAGVVAPDAAGVVARSHGEAEVEGRRCGLVEAEPAAGSSSAAVAVPAAGNSLEAREGGVPEGTTGEERQEEEEGIEAAPTAARVDGHDWGRRRQGEGCRRRMSVMMRGGGRRGGQGNGT